MITVIFYSHHTVLTLHCIPATENVQCCFPSSLLCWFFYFCISSFILHFSCFRRINNILILLHIFPLKKLQRAGGEWKARVFISLWAFFPIRIWFGTTVFLLDEGNISLWWARLCVLPIFR